MGRDALIKFIDDLIYKAYYSEYRYDEANIFYEGLEELKKLLDKSPE